MAKIPSFKKDEEAAAFWETHSLADFDEDLELASEVAFELPQKQTLSVRLDARDVQLLKKLARYKGIGHSTLARIWVKEKLDEVTHRPKHRA
ncbi:MAG: CopG family antitoxin [bacterium]